MEALNIETVGRRLNKAIMTGDHLYHEKNPDHYFKVGASAIECIRYGLDAAKLSNPPKYVLDFGCGSGRVARWLKAAFPEAVIVCSDLRRDSLQFLERELSVIPHLSSDDLSKIEFECKFDLIWCGSVVTHLPQSSTCALFSQMGKWMRPGGLAVVTSHGREVARRLALPTQKYIHQSDVPAVLLGYAEDGYGYVDYVNRKGIGFSLSKLEHLSQLAQQSGLETVLVDERAWDNHQDTLCVKRPS